MWPGADLQNRAAAGQRVHMQKNAGRTRANNRCLPGNTLPVRKVKAYLNLEKEMAGYLEKSVPKFSGGVCRQACGPRCQKNELCYEIYITVSRFKVFTIFANLYVAGHTGIENAGLQAG